MEKTDEQTAVRVLFTSSGRRVELVEIFKQEGFFTHAADCSSTAPTLFRANKRHVVPRITEDPDLYVDALLDIVKKEKIQVVIPLIDTELTFLAEAGESFRELDARIMISSSDHVAIAFDKYRTYRFFKTIGLPTPETYLVEELVKNKDYKERYKSLFPALLKPRYGSAGQGIIDCSDMEHVLFFHSRGELQDYVLQKKLGGVEVTTDIMGDGEGKMFGSVQRRRLKIRGGEVERGVTVKHDLLFQYTERFTRQYKPFGVVNIQCFYEKDKDKAHYIEINPRFGGGYPLAYHAGANFPDIIRRMINREKIKENSCDYDDGLIMTRYDSAVYYKP